MPFPALYTLDELEWGEGGVGIRGPASGWFRGAASLPIVSLGGIVIVATMLKKSLLGEVLLEDGVVEEEHLTRALKIQAVLEQSKQLGEVLAELGYATRQAIHDTIAKHGKRMQLGEILVEQGHVTPQDLETALKVQRKTKGPIGKILVQSRPSRFRQIARWRDEYGADAYAVHVEKGTIEVD